MKRLMIAAVLAVASGFVAAQSTPVGAWRTVDEKSKKDRTLVRITETGGVLSGKVEKYLDPSIPADAVCEACTDTRKGQPILGMTILQGIRKNADKDNVWDGGLVLDPENGKTYKVLLRPKDGGTKLEVRGYVGSPMFGRSQTWIRAE
jgi:uncharacterized protein (DUF2147 family)